MSANRRTRRARRPGRTCAGTPSPTQNRRSASAYGAPGHHPHHAQAGLYQGRAQGRSAPSAQAPTVPAGTNPVHIPPDTARHSTALPSTNRHVSAPLRTSALVGHSSLTTDDVLPARSAGGGSDLSGSCRAPGGFSLHGLRSGTTAHSSRTCAWWTDSSRPCDRRFGVSAAGDRRSRASAAPGS
jgi:hypothetical protein